MDDRDRELIAMLRENARAPTALIARRLGLSRTTVQARLERLERSGVIAGYGVRLSDDVERGLIRAHVLVTILPKTAPRIETELDRIGALDGVERTLSSIILSTRIDR
jgi:DNA-binding Lrp family transcriptional regulator